MNQKSLLQILLFAFCLISLWYLISTLRSHPVVNSYKYLENYKSEANPNHRYILLWTSFFNNRSWYLSDKTTFTEQFFREMKCPQTACTITTDRTMLKSVTEYDALMFHGAEPWTPITHQLPTERSPHQYYVLGIQESPAHTKHNFDEQVNFFNWTMTYRFDSDILYPYGLVKDVETQEVVAPKAFPKWREQQDYYEPEILTEIANKKKKIAWFVSHCQTYSKRENLAKEISKIIPIDIYGECGELKCTRGEDSCYKMLTTDYKFYLSFENSVCQDYVTEKLYNAMQELVVPIVFGGADYSKFAPPGSYINANDFKNPTELAAYIKFLDENPKEYVKYFWWLTYYYVPRYPAPSNEAFCQLCIKLHNPNGKSLQTVYGNVNKWWYNGMCINKPRIVF